MPKQKQSQRKPPALLIFVGIGLIFLAVIAFKSNQQSPAPAISLEEQYQRALQEKQPTFVFLHSMDCIPCKAMIDVVDQVQPEFEGQVVLIDVDVYDQRNIDIMRREGLQMIPTLIFYNRQGERQVQIGVLQPDQLRAVLDAISGAN